MVSYVNSQRSTEFKSQNLCVDLLHLQKEATNHHYSTEWIDINEGLKIRECTTDHWKCLNWSKITNNLLRLIIQGKCFKTLNCIFVQQFNNPRTCVNENCFLVNFIKSLFIQAELLNRINWFWFPSLLSWLVNACYVSLLFRKCYIFTV